MRSYQQFFAELKRRSVFKVSAVYGALAFALLQVAEPLAGALSLPGWFVPLVVALLLLGFPVALVLAWAFDITPEGVRRTPDAPDEELARIVSEPVSARWPAGVLALVGVALLVAGAWWTGLRSGRSGAVAAPGAGLGTSAAAATLAHDGDAASDARPSIAVLAFDDMSPQSDQGHFSDGITEEILNTLARVRELRVAARTSAFAFKNRQIDLRDVADSLGVDYVVEGSVRKAGDRLRITAQLIDGEDGSHMWSDQYDRDMEDIFAIQTELAEAIAAQLRIPLGLDERERLVSATDDMQAFNEYLEGRRLMRERGTSIEGAIALFESAIARDSSWAPPWAGLAESRALLPFYAVPRADSAFWENSLADAERAAERALELDPRNASAAVALGNIHRDRWEWDAAAAAYARALALDPDNVEAHQQYAEYLCYTGRLDEAYTAALRALDFDPSPIRYNVAGYIARYRGDYAAAKRLLDAGIAAGTAEKTPQLWGHRALVELATDASPLGRELYLRWLSAAAPELVKRVERAWPAGEAQPTADAAEAMMSHNVVNAAELWMLRGEPERALSALQRGAAQRVPFGPVGWSWDVLWDPLRSDPRFREVSAKWTATR